MSTYMANKANIERKWYVVDAAGKPLGKTAVVVADLLRGKGKGAQTREIEAALGLFTVQKKECQEKNKQPIPKADGHAPKEILQPNERGQGKQDQYAPNLAAGALFLPVFTPKEPGGEEHFKNTGQQLYRRYHSYHSSPPA